MKIKHIESTGQYEVKTSDMTIYFFIKNKKNIRIDTFLVFLTILNNSIPSAKASFTVNLFDTVQLLKKVEGSYGLLRLDADKVTSIINQSIPLLEKKLQEQKAPSKPEDYIINKDKGLELLKDTDLIEKIKEALKQKIVGDYKIPLLTFLSGVSYKFNTPINTMLIGDSSQGKSHILKTVTSLLPAEDVQSLVRVTKSAFQNFNNNELVGKSLLIEDYSSLPEEVRLNIREFQTNKKLGVAKHNHHLGESELKEIKGHFSTLMASTTDKIKIDNLNRCFIQHLDDSEGLTQQIINHKALVSSGQVDFSSFEDFQAVLQDAIRMLEDVPVVNPYAVKLVSISIEADDQRRLFELILSLIDVITLFNQKNREKDELGRLIVTKADVELALELTLDMFIIKSDDLGKLDRKFIEKLKNILSDMCQKGATMEDVDFKVKDLYEPLKEIYGTSTIHARIKSLQSLGLIQPSGGNKKMGEKFRLVHNDRFEEKKNRIRTHFSETLNEVLV